MGTSADTGAGYISSGNATPLATMFLLRALALVFGSGAAKAMDSVLLRASYDFSAVTSEPAVLEAMDSDA